MAVVSLCSAKGGVGRTTLAICLADLFARQGSSVAIIDADWKQNCRYWKFSATDGCPVAIIACKDPDKIEGVISEAAKRYSLVFVDHEGIGSSPSTTFAINESDLILIPTTISCIDHTEVMRAYHVVKDTERKVRRKIATRVIFNQMPTFGNSLSMLALNRIASQGIPYFESFLHRRIAYEEMHFIGHTPITNSSAGEARLELNRIAQEIKDIFVFRSHDSDRMPAFA